MFNVANFDGIVDVQNEIILQVCSGVDEQLGELVSGEEGETHYKKVFCSFSLSQYLLRRLSLIPLLHF